MAVLLPSSVDEALRALAEHPRRVRAGGRHGPHGRGQRRSSPRRRRGRTGRHRRPQELAPRPLHRHGHDRCRRSPTARCSHAPLATMLPALAEAARTVGSPQIRNAGTIGGNLGTASPAGDALPVLSALDAVVELAGPGGRRAVVIHDFLLGVKRTALEPGELVVSVTVPVVARLAGLREGRCAQRDGHRRHQRLPRGRPRRPLRPGGARRRRPRRSCGPGRPRRGWPARSTGIGGACPTLRWPPGSRTRVAAEARPIDDHRSTAEYRRHAVGVLARRLLHRAFPR